MSKWTLALIVGTLALIATTQMFARPAAGYLPPDANLDPQIPTPESVLGWQVGEWHVSHDKLVEYIRRLADVSPRVRLKEIGRSHEQRPLLLLAVSSEENAQNLEALREKHIAGREAAPLVVWLGYSVHGDEPSGSNAAMLLAYYLAAARSEQVTELLAGTIVLIDPSLNPDGLNRHASWVNANAGVAPVDDPATRQHRQDWPEGRTNHYLFDLNRDWLPLVHPESRARLAEYRQWLPHVLTDHHEQEGYPGFFFQPGVPTRQNPLTPQANFDLTRALAEYHARAMDEAGQPAFTEEAFDDFYYGKGSTYPDINGSIGILFEQKAIGGQALKTSNGTETFHMAVANHLRTSLSTLNGAWALRDRLKRYQRQFFEDMRDAAEETGIAGWIVGDDGDAGRAGQFLDLLSRHDIEFHPIGEAVQAGEHRFTIGRAWFLPARQRQSGLLRSVMEQRTQFQDETFYDVSAWTLPLAYNLPFARVRNAPALADHAPSSSGLPPDRQAVGWLIPWNQLHASPTLQKMLAAGARVRTAIKPFSATTETGLTAFASGALLVQSGIQPEDRMDDIISLLTEASLSGLQVYSAGSNFTALGPDFGSEKFALVKPVRPLIVVGRGISEYHSGEIWHQLDLRLGIPTTMVEHWRLGEVRIDDYTHLIWPDGDYENVDPILLDAIREWVQAGGVAIASGRAATWLEGICFEEDPELCVSSEEQSEESATPPASRPYGSFDDDVARLTIGGAIVATHLDTTHPLAFGFPRASLPIMRVGATLLAESENAYSTPVRYLESPLLAGYVGAERLSEFAGAPAVIAEKRGEGLIVRFADNPLFRGFWRGSERLFLNALFFGQVVEATQLPE